MNDYVKERSDRLFKLGLKFNGSGFIYEDINFDYTDLICMTNEEFEKAYEGLVKRKQRIDLVERR